MADGPLIVQSDKTILLEVAHPESTPARHAIAAFAELERAPEHMHSYRITPLGLWNASAAGLDAEHVVDTLLRYSRYPVPHALLLDIAEVMARYGRLRLEQDPQHGLVLRSDDELILAEVCHVKKVAALLGARIDPLTVVVHGAARGELKQLLLKAGWPADDLAGYVDGTAHLMALTETTLTETTRPAPSENTLSENTGPAPWTLRQYQRTAEENFWAGGSGVVVLPCGAGKTIVGAAAMAASGTTTLILVTNTLSARQWKAELLKRTTLTASEIGEYSGSVKEVRPVTIATYQVLTTRRNGSYPHLELLNDNDWGLLIYDEVHLLPAPIFRMTAELQARRRLGLTATLVREDGREGEVFALIGPKRYDAPWKDIEAQGYIAPADCVEVRVDLARSERLAYATADDGAKYRLCATSLAKSEVAQTLVAAHAGEQILVIGQYIDQLDELAARLAAPLIKGSTPVKERERLFAEFRDGRLSVLVVSKVANFSIDLPEASVAIQVSGAFGSRQEEAQRLGRLMRPKSDGRTARFYTLVARDTVDADFAAKRQRFLAEQGYAYRIIDAADAGDAGATPDAPSTEIPPR
ncbi:DNA repair helicase XPB [Specibacter sp. AOP5-B1-6]|uniref:DNA repair helicase XPB n=1 Tax=Specibacter sp. AOP5-B1-6 TaxID=3457653 RepID=UPI00402B13DC